MEGIAMTMRDLVRWGRRDAPVRREGEGPFLALQDEMNRVFDRFFHGVPSLWTEGGEWPAGGFSPRVDVSETDNDIRVTAELPGLDEKDIEVSVTRDALTIRGEKKEEKETRKEGYFHTERYFGSFTRTVPLPREVVTDKAEATFKKGVLTISLPKTEQVKSETRKVQVKAG
jgi:HSP20 family protein